jgi:ABC-type Fe3+-citrate transport system substrate-binding protein
MAVGNLAFLLKKVKETEKAIAEKQEVLKKWKARLEKKRKEQSSIPIEHLSSSSPPITDGP